MVGEQEKSGTELSLSRFLIWRSGLLPGTEVGEEDHLAQGV